MKKYFVTALCVVSMHLLFANAPEVNKKTVSAFEFAFKEATEVVWYPEETSDLVYFKMNNIKTQIRYNKEGKFISCLRMYKEQDLPILVQIRLKETYAEKKVTGVTELTTEGSTDFYINMEDEKFVYILKADTQGNFSMDKKMRRG